MSAGRDGLGRGWRPRLWRAAVGVLLGLAAAATAVTAMAMAGCGGGEPGASPESAVRQLIAAARAGDRVAVYNRLGPRTRGRIDEILASSRKSGGARLLQPEDLVTVGWVPPAWEASSFRELHRQPDSAEVEVASAAGDRQTVVTVREGRRWTVELPLR
jgi:hypothetical protein